MQVRSVKCQQLFKKIINNKAIKTCSKILVRGVYHQVLQKTNIYIYIFQKKMKGIMEQVV